MDGVRPAPRGRATVPAVRTRLPVALLLALLTACGGGAEPAAAPPRPSPAPSPSPLPVLFDVSAVEAALLTTADVPAGYAEPDPALGLPPAQPRRTMALCQAPQGVTPPPVPPAPSVLFQGKAGFDAVTQSVAVLPDEATATAVLAAVQRHAARCEKTRTQTIGGGSFSAVQTTTLAAVVPLTSGQWKGVRQSSSSTYEARRTQRWQTQTVVLRRGNAVLQLEVSGESAPPDLAPVLAEALAKLDATL